MCTTGGTNGGTNGDRNDVRRLQVISRIGPAVDRSAVGDPESAVSARLHGLAPHLDGEPDPAFRAATRARLVAMAAVRSPEPEPVSPLRRLMTLRSSDAVPAGWHTRLTAGLAGAALTVTALATLVALSTGARPGDVLYGLKRGTEQTQLALAGDSRRGQTLLDLAGTRLDELTYLVSEHATALPGALPADGAQAVLAAGGDPELVLQTLETMDAQTTEGAAWIAEQSVAADDARPLDGLAAWAADQSAGLAAVEADVPEAARAAFDGSQYLLTQIGTRTQGLDVALACPAGPATAGADQLGPVPGPCDPVAPTPGEEPATSTGAGDGTPLPLPAGEVPGQTGGGTGVPQNDGTAGGTAGGGSTGGLPGGGAPPVPDPGTPGDVDVPTLPVPVPVPGISVSPPGLTTVPGTAITPTVPSIDVGPGVCVGPIPVGNC
jgi:hypothetical protein